MYNLDYPDIMLVYVKARQHVVEIEFQTNVKSKYFRRVCPDPSLLLFFTYFETALLLMIFTLIVPLSVMI